MKVKIKKLDDNAVIPVYAHPGEDACFDLSILIDADKNLPMKVSGGEITPISIGDGKVFDSMEIIPLESVIFHTGLSFEIEKGYAMKIYDRSSTGIKKGLILSNGTAVIDSNYRGEVLISFTNISNKPININNLDRLCQAEITKVIDVEFECVDELSETDRGEGGFGSTGNN